MMTHLSAAWACFIAAATFALVGAASLGAEPAPLIPREVLFASPPQTRPQISPDATRLAYLGRSAEGILNLWIRTLGKSDDRQATHDRRRGIFHYVWSTDGRRLLYIQDRDGDENWHLHSLDLESGQVRDLTPFVGVRAENVLVDARHPDEVLVGLNLRDRRVSDVHRVNLVSGAVTMETENPGDVVEWVTDPDFVIRAASAIRATDASTVIRVRDSATGPWRDLQTWPFAEAGFDRYQRILSFTRDGKRLIVQSPIESNTTRLVELDISSGREREVTRPDRRADLWNTFDFAGAYLPAAVLLDPETREVQAYATDHLKPQWQAKDPSFREDLDFLRNFRNGVFTITSRDRKDSRWIVRYRSDIAPAVDYLYERGRRGMEKLFGDRTELEAYQFAEMKTLSFRARDGLEIPAYLTLPVGVPRRDLPLVLLPHGGPWFRDEWGFDAEVQWLANRGYAVLQIQFRGSIGFGKKFLNASRGEMGGAMQNDLSDGVEWAVQQGIADPARVAIMGGSYGGYAVLAGLAFTPHLYACGVEAVGPSNLKTLFQSFPPYWAARLKRWTLMVGDVVADQALNRKLSPLFHVANMRAPLLIAHGANDPRVKITESEQIVRALRERGLPVTYVVYPDEGHGVERPANRLDYAARVEEFLGAHLGGRVEPWVPVTGSSAEVQ